MVVFEVSFAPLKVTRLPNFGDVYPKLYFNGSEASSSTQSFVAIKNGVLIVVPFFGVHEKFPPQGCLPAVIVNVLKSERPRLFVAVNLKV